MALKMYVLVAYNLSDIQKGIQAAHAVASYGYVKMSNKLGILKKDYIQWATKDMTLIVLNGGTTGESGALQQYVKDLATIGVDVVTFTEPDLNNAETAAAFLLDDERDSAAIGYLKQMRLA